jgi:hypothetical protein
MWKDTMSTEATALYGESTDGVTTPGASDVVGWEAKPFSEGVRVSVLLVGCVLCVTGVLGNVLILLTLVTQRSLRTQHPLHVGNLAVADLLFMVLIVPGWLVDVATDQPAFSNQLHCQTNAFIFLTCMFTSLYTLVLTSFNRYLRLYYQPLYARLFSKRSCVAALLAASWLLAAAQSALPLLGLGPGYVYNRYSRMCAFSACSGPSPTSVAASCNFCLSVVAVGFFCGKIFRKYRVSRICIERWAQHHSRTSTGTPQTPRQSSDEQAQQQQQNGRMSGSSSDQAHQQTTMCFALQQRHDATAGHPCQQQPSSSTSSQPSTSLLQVPRVHYKQRRMQAARPEQHAVCQRGPVQDNSDVCQRCPVQDNPDVCQRGPVQDNPDVCQRGPVQDNPDVCQRGPVQDNPDVC